MRTDTEYLRGLADNENLPSLMRDTLRAAAAEIETLRADWARLAWDNASKFVERCAEIVSERDRTAKEGDQHGAE